MIAIKCVYLNLKCQRHNCLHVCLYITLYSCLDMPDLTYTYIDCYIDDDTLDLPALQWKYPNMTIEKCAAHCIGFNYFGLQV